MSAGIGTTHNRALCCECGTCRTISKNAGLRNHRSRGESPEEIAPKYWSKVLPWQRQLADMKCGTCKEITSHALILDCLPEYRDLDERQVSA